MLRLPHILAFVALTGVAPAQTFVVDGAGSGNYKEISTALANVNSGSTLVVKYYAAGYQPFRIANKSVTIVGSLNSLLLPPVVLIPGRGATGVQIGPLGAGDHVIIEGLHFLQSSSITGIPLRITGVQGSVSMQQCVFEGSSPYSDFHARIENSTAVGMTGCVSRNLLINPGTTNHWLFRIDKSDVAFSQCSFSGRDSGSSTLPGAPAIDVTQSRITIHDGIFAGGRGHYGGNTAGGPAVVLRLGSTLLATGRPNRTYLRGGSAGSSSARDGDCVVLTLSSVARIEGFAPTATNGGGAVVVDSSSVARVNPYSQPPLHRSEGPVSAGVAAFWTVDAPAATPLLFLLGFDSVFIDVGFVGPIRVVPLATIAATAPAQPPMHLGVKVPLGTSVGTHLVTQCLNLSGREVWASDAAVAIVR
ncbi:MAG: hypothetical protein KDC87_12500 [Planctomycetes bacterium]|nr:hypothetical protein [Planctomycetota bacterium]